jgi:hypothetical protein
VIAAVNNGIKFAGHRCLQRILCYSAMGLDSHELRPRAARAAEFSHRAWRLAVISVAGD